MTVCRMADDLRVARNDASPWDTDPFARLAVTGRRGPASQTSDFTGIGPDDDSLARVLGEWTPTGARSPITSKLSLLAARS